MNDDWRGADPRSNWKPRDWVALVGIVLFLLALLLPALQQTDTNPYRSRCANNLRQIGLALHQHHHLHGHFPSAMGGEVREGMRDIGGGRLSGLVWILPYIERGGLYEQLLQPTTIYGVSYPPMTLPPWIVEYAPWREQIELFLCPSVRAESDLGMTSYGFCIGDMAREIHEPTVTRGAFACRRITTLTDISDGQSYTIAMSEFRVAPFAINQSAKLLDNPSLCFSIKLKLSDELRGGRWADGAAGYGLVNTILPPGSPSCAVGGAEEVDGIYSAGSEHPGGFNALMADASVRFINTKIDAGNSSAPTPTVEQMARDDFPSPYGVWGALGTARGGEAAPTW